MQKQKHIYDNNLHYSDSPINIVFGSSCVVATVWGCFKKKTLLNAVPLTNTYIYDTL